MVSFAKGCEGVVENHINKGRLYIKRIKDKGGGDEWENKEELYTLYIGMIKLDEYGTVRTSINKFFLFYINIFCPHSVLFSCHLLFRVSRMGASISFLMLKLLRLIMFFFCIGDWASTVYRLCLLNDKVLIWIHLLIIWCFCQC